jgi:hypothetical protein
MKNFKINRGVELMLRGERSNKEEDLTGFSISKIFSFLKTKVYFNFELRWEREDQ